MRFSDRSGDEDETQYKRASGHQVGESICHCPDPVSHHDALMKAFSDSMDSTQYLRVEGQDLGGFAIPVPDMRVHKDGVPLIEDMSKYEFHMGQPGDKFVSSGSKSVSGFLDGPEPASGKEALAMIRAYDQDSEKAWLEKEHEKRERRWSLSFVWGLRIGLVCVFMLGFWAGYAVGSAGWGT